MAIRFNPATAWPRQGRAFNHGVVAPDGRTLYVTGQVAWDKNGHLVGEGDGETQIRKCFDNVCQILAEAGGNLEDIVLLTIYFTDPADLPAIQAVRAEKISADTAPASVLIQVPGLVSPELRVELVPIAVVPLERFREPSGQS
ncbi:RidA family protein [Ruegeria hyattellae]|uniref:RidA family protein n=1 Tax=Ruegeria hyattellae TaxID=3233337 RepID=UPI00355C2135